MIAQIVLSGHPGSRATGILTSLLNPPSAERIDAEACMARIASHRDREAFKSLFLLFAPKVKAYLIRHGATAGQAEELAQEALLTLWRRADAYDARRASVPTWLFTIARNLRIDIIRRERSALAYALSTPAEDLSIDASPAHHNEIAEREARLRDAVRVLPAEQMEVVRLSFFQDKPHAQIARELALPLGTVKSRLRLAVARLRTVLEDLA